MARRSRIHWHDWAHLKEDDPQAHRPGRQGHRECVVLQRLWVACSQRRVRGQGASTAYGLGAALAREGRRSEKSRAARQACPGVCRHAMPGTLAAPLGGLPLPLAGVRRMQAAGKLCVHLGPQGCESTAASPLPPAGSARAAQTSLHARRMRRPAGTTPEWLFARLGEAVVAGGSCMRDRRQCTARRQLLGRHGVDNVQPILPAMSSYTAASSAGLLCCSSDTAQHVGNGRGGKRSAVWPQDGACRAGCRCRLCTARRPAPPLPRPYPAHYLGLFPGPPVTLAFRLALMSGMLTLLPTMCTLHDVPGQRSRDQGAEGRGRPAGH